MKFTIIGAGYIGTRHKKIIEAAGHEVITVDTDISKDPDYTDIETMLEFYPANELQVCVICTPNGSHAEIAIKCLQAGKHVIIEKPVALKTSDAEKIIYESLQANRKVFCVMQNRLTPVAVWFKNVIESDQLGRIFSIRVDLFWNRNQEYYKKSNWKGTKDQDGGILFTQFSHFIDLVFWFFGPIKILSSHIKNRNHEYIEIDDTGVALFETNFGILGSINFSTCSKNQNFSSSIAVIAEKGTIEIGGQYMNEIKYIEGIEKPYLIESKPANDYGTYKGSANNHDLFYGHVFSVFDKNMPINPNIYEGMKVVEIIENIYKKSI